MKNLSCCSCKILSGIKSIRVCLEETRDSIWIIHKKKTTRIETKCHSSAKQANGACSNDNHGKRNAGTRKIEIENRRLKKEKSFSSKSFKIMFGWNIFRFDFLNHPIDIETCHADIGENELAKIGGNGPHGVQHFCDMFKFRCILYLNTGRGKKNWTIMNSSAKKNFLVSWKMIFSLRSTSDAL